MTPLEKENRDLRSENARLVEQLEDVRGELADLRRDVGAEQDSALMRQLKEALPKLQPGDAWLLAMLYEARGQVVSRERIHRYLPTSDSEVEASKRLIAARLHHLRKALGRESIRNCFKVGWALTAAGVAACDAAISRGRA